MSTTARRPSQIDTSNAGSSSSSPLSGWLLKLGGQVKKFKRRFLRIQGQRLEYYRRPPSGDREPESASKAANKKNDRLGVIPLTGATLTQFDPSIYGRDYVFGIQPSHSKRIFVLAGSSCAERDQWLATLKTLVDKRERERSGHPQAVTGSLKEGFIERWSEEKRRWSDRFLILTASQLEFRKEREGNPAGAIPIDSSVSVLAENSDSKSPDQPASEAGWSMFSLHSQSSKRAKYFIRVKKESERDEWVHAIQSAILKAEGEGGTDAANPSRRNSAAIVQTVQANFQYSDSESEDLSEMSLDSNSEPEPESPGIDKKEKKAFPKSASSTPARSAAASPSESTVRVLNAHKPLTQRETQRVVYEGFLKRLTGPKAKPGKPEYARLVGWSLRLFANKDDEKPREELHMIATLTQREDESTMGLPFCFSIQETLASCRQFYFQAASAEDLEEWVYILDMKYSFSDVGLPLFLNAKVHVNMHYSPDANQLNAITVNSGHEIKEEEVDEDDAEMLNVPSSGSISLSPPPSATHTKNNSSLTSANVATASQAREGSRSLLRSVVSKKKRRFVIQGFDLDLTYVTDRIIAMGFPSEGLEAIYRNRMEDVQRFFDTRHTDRFKIYNLCSERKYPHERFHNRVVEFPFDDHNCPQFQDMAYFCADVADWLNAHPKNICVIHCKAGKGRTGLMICVFLLYLGEWRTADEALRYYAFARTQNQKGVTIPSQIRYVHYFDRYMSLSRAGGQLPAPQAMILKRMKFGKGAPSFDLMTANCRGKVWTSKDYPWKQIKHKDGSVEYIAEEGKDSTPYTFVSDFHVEFSKKKTFGGKARCMGFWLHTQFFEGTTIKLTKAQIDKVNKKKEAPNFELELFFEADPQYEDRVKRESARQMELGKEFVMKGGLCTRYLEKWEDQTLEFCMWVRDEKEKTRKAGEKPQIQDFVLCCCDSERRENFESVKDIPDKDRTLLFRFSPTTNILVGSTHEIWQQHALAKSRAVEERCFSILNQDGPEGSNFAPMHLEAPTERQLAMWLEGIKAIYASVGSRIEDKQEQKHSQPSEPNTPAPGQSGESKAASGSSTAESGAPTVENLPAEGDATATDATGQPKRGRRLSITTRKRVISFYHG